MSSITFKPSADRVLVKPDPAEERTASGLLIADTAKEKPQRGEVIAVGPGKTAENGTLVAPQLKTGDKVLYGKYSGTELTIEGTEYLIMKESDVFGTL